MSQTILILLGFAVIVILFSRKTRETAAGICSSALDQTVRKNTNKERILTLLAEKSELSNADIREILRVSDRTATRYMDGLEKEGKVRQAGATGRGVIYRLK